MMQRKYFIFMMLTTFFFCKASKNLDNVLLIINYNHAHYESIPLLKKIYAPYFKNIVFYGPAAHPEVTLLHHNRGYFSYRCIADAMKRYQEFDGYFFLMDDCILNAWKLAPLDTSKIWSPKMTFFKNDNGDSIDLKKGIKATAWSWWKTEWGYGPTKKAYDELPPVYKKTLTENWGEGHVLCAFSDIAYIPASLRKNFIELADIFGKYNVFLEIALPVIMSCLNKKNEWVWLPGTGGTYGSLTSEKEINLDVFFQHPIKLSFLPNRVFVERIFDQMEKR